MTHRMVRINKLVQRELNLLLHTIFRESASKISITDIAVSPDLHDAYVYFSVIGNSADVAKGSLFLKRHAGILRHKLFHRVRLRVSPRLNFRYDPSPARGQQISKILDGLENGE